MSIKFAGDVVTDGVPTRRGNLFLGLLAGVVAAALGAVIWMAVAVGTGLHIGFVALGVGALVGFAVRWGGHGSSVAFGIIGAVLTLISCLAGEVFTTVELATSAERDFYQSLMAVDLGQLMTSILDRTDAVMYVIYAIGVFEGYKFSIVRK